MNHRKIVHPSNKKCRNFPSGACSFGNECWYVHDSKTSTESKSDNFKCDLCGEDFKGRANFKRHKKLLHPQVVPQCEKFKSKNCARGEKECWFEHNTEDKMSQPNSWPKLDKNSAGKKDTPVFCEVSKNAFPPDQLNMMMKMLGNLCSKVQKMEEKFENLMN